MINLDMQASIAKTVAKEYFGKLLPEVDQRIDEISFETTLAQSHFDNEKKIVYIGADHLHDVNTFVHELFHAISTNYLSDRVHIGFNNKTFKKINNDEYLETSYGYAINEGATHAFTRDATAGRFGEIQPISSYNQVANIYKNLERYVGKNIMKILYINSNARNFVTTVSKVFHTSEENVLKLVLSMDAYLDTYRIFTVFMENFESADVSSLLANCYVYLSKIISDKMAFEKKNFDFEKDILTTELSQKEKENMCNSVKKYGKNMIFAKNFDITAKMYEKMAMQIICKEHGKNLKILDIPKEFKCAEFYNFLFLSNYICDENKIRKDFKNQDIKASLTQKIYSKKFGAFIEDETLPTNIRTALSARYAIRANCVTSDYYMKKCFENKEFGEYLKSSDEDYYNALSEMIHNENLMKKYNSGIDKKEEL